MSGRAVFVLAIALVVAAAPATCSRPFDDAAAWIKEHFEAAQAELSGLGHHGKPSFCHDLDCPKYKVTNHTDGYETRSYKSGRWAYTKVQGLTYTISITEGFERLFKYISGENANSTKIPMTAPVLTAISPGQGPFCKSNFTIAFFVPFEYQSNAPEPRNTEVYLAESPHGEVFVSQFGGFLIDGVLESKVEQLRKALVANGEDFLDDGSYFTASYDPPFRFEHRHNEIWIPKKPKTVQDTASLLLTS